MHSELYLSLCMHRLQLTDPLIPIQTIRVVHNWLKEISMEIVVEQGKLSHQLVSLTNMLHSDLGLSQLLLKI